jgi:uncharacterized Fe-S center protein
MIKRHYFVAYRRDLGNGTGSYSCGYKHITRASWLDESPRVLQEMIEIIREQETEKHGNAGYIEVICFARC